MSWLHTILHLDPTPVSIATRAVSTQQAVRCAACLLLRAGARLLTRMKYNGKHSLPVVQGRTGMSSCWNSAGAREAH